MSEEVPLFETGEQAKRPACAHLDWRNVAETPEDMPEFKVYCRALRQFLPQRTRDRDAGLCVKCIIYKPTETEEKGKK